MIQILEVSDLQIQEEDFLTESQKYLSHFNLDQYFTVPEQGKVVHGKVKQVIVADKTVVLKSGENIPFDYLVVASGMSNISLMVGGRYETGIIKFAPETKEEGSSDMVTSYNPIPTIHKSCH